MLSLLYKMWHNRISLLCGIITYCRTARLPTGRAKNESIIYRKDVDYNEGFSY